MKKLLIIVGIILLLVLAGVWTYIFLYGTPKSVDEIFARFSSAPEESYTGGEENSTVDLGEDGGGGPSETPSRLYQLTTRPVAGATFIDGGIRYVERGTGHIYEIDLQGGNERVISATTNQRTIRATFSPNGDYVALVSDTGSALETVLGSLSGGSGDGALDVIALPEGAREASFSRDGETLNFFVPNRNGGTGYAYSLSKRTATELFTIPLAHVRILWGNPTYVFTTPSAYAMGYLYKIGKGGQLTYVTKGGMGLSAFATPSTTLVSTFTESGIDTIDIAYGSVPIDLFTEKCTEGTRGTHLVYCASPQSLDAGRPYPDDWYKGVSKFTDSILLVDSKNSSVSLVSALEEEAGRPIDVSSIGSDTAGTLIYLVNKYDGTLWMLDTSKLPPGFTPTYE